MALTVTLPLTPEEQAALEAQARARGVPVDSLLRKAVLQVIAAGSDLQPPMSLEQWEREFDEWLDGQPNLPTLPDAAISREHIYTREDE